MTTFIFRHEQSSRFNYILLCIRFGRRVCHSPVDPYATIKFLFNPIFVRQFDIDGNSSMARAIRTPTHVSTVHHARHDGYTCVRCKWIEIYMKIDSYRRSKKANNKSPSFFPNQHRNSLHSTFICVRLTAVAMNHESWPNGAAYPARTHTTKRPLTFTRKCHYHHQHTKNRLPDTQGQRQDFYCYMRLNAIRNRNRLEPDWSSKWQAISSKSIWVIISSALFFLDALFVRQL